MSREMVQPKAVRAVSAKVQVLGEAQVDSGGVRRGLLGKGASARRRAPVARRRAPVAKARPPVGTSKQSQTWSKKNSHALVNARKYCKNYDQVSGPSYPGLKLSDGSPAAADWFKPYMTEALDPELKRLGCNPASCAKQPLACKIPVCQGFDPYDPKVKVRGKSIYHSANMYPPCRWSGWVGCRRKCPHAMKQMRDVDSSSFTYAPKGMLFFLGFPGSRRGWYYSGERLAVHAGQCLPVAYKGIKHVGSWMTPDVRFCNPNQITSCHKASFLHSGIIPNGCKGARTTVGLTKCRRASRRITGLVHKTTVCFGAKCYVHKEGVCMRMNHDVWKEWGGSKDKMKSAIDAWKKGQYTPCKKWAQKVINQQIALF